MAIKWLIDASYFVAAILFILGLKGMSSPVSARKGIVWAPLFRMRLGIYFAAVAWLVVAALQHAMDGGAALSIWWQVLPYVLLTMGEVWVSATGLEFAFSQAPAEMKGTIMSFWNLATSIGNLWVLLTNAAVRNDGVVAGIKSTGLGHTTFLMIFFACFAAISAWTFGRYARSYAMKDHYRAA